MYQIIGVQRNQQQRLVATPATTQGARTHYYGALPSFQSVIINDPDGNTIDIDELERRADAEGEESSS